MSVFASASVSWPPMLARRASVLAMRACRRRLVLLQSGDLFLVLFLALVERGKPGLHLTKKLLALGLEFVAPEALELELVLQLIRQCLEFGFALLDAFLQGSYGVLLRLQSLEFLLCRFAGAVLEVVNQFFQGLLDDGGGDGLVLLRFVGGDFLRCLRPPRPARSEPR